MSSDDVTILCGGVLAGLAAVSCAPPLQDVPWLVERPAVVDVTFEPPDLRPGQIVRSTARVVSPVDTTYRVVWSLCAEGAPPMENRSLPASCLDGSFVLPLGEGESIEWSVPQEACAVFGPDAFILGLRPQDPDATGGYFVPVRVVLRTTEYGEAFAGAFLRVQCNLADAPATAARAFEARYVANRAPSPQSTDLAFPTVELDDETYVAGEVRTLTVAMGPGDAESFARFDKATQRVVDGAEVLFVRWFATAGTLSAARTEFDAVGASSVTWEAPTGGIPATLAAVVRDSRGATAFARRRFVARVP